MIKPTNNVRIQTNKRTNKHSLFDAFFYTVGHPNGAIQEATSGKRKVRFVPITGVDALINDNLVGGVLTLGSLLVATATSVVCVRCWCQGATACSFPQRMM